MAGSDDSMTKLDLYETYDGAVEGDMNVPGRPKTQILGEPGFNTLDEPIRVTVARDLKAVGVKFKHVLYPTEKKSLLKEWDLWGPLLLCTFMAISFFQSVCVLGYCLLPTTIALIVCRLILMTEQSYFLFTLRFFVTIIGFAWATFASVLFLGDSQPPGRKALAVYPIFLFYFIISWLVLSHTVE
ncbi:protein YIPF6 isoform X2 [Lycorma delicatula]|uniref:protein YIPF6 isoform X2 n=1 Tax=Lycorma delicatula TaxID=130591 RepID=UPI003F5161BE